MAAEGADETASPTARFDAVGVACLLLASVGWGVNWPLLKILLLEWPPLFTRGVAGLCAACALAGYAAARGESLRVPAPARGPLGWAAFTNVFAFMGFSSLAMLWLSAGEGALLVYTMPVWATLLAWPILGRPPSLRALAALALCLVGVLVLFGHGAATLGHEKLPGIALALAAAVLFALGTVTSRGALPMPPVAATAWQVGLGCAPMLLYGLVVERPDVSALSPEGWAALAYMTAVPMALCFLTWFAAIRRLSPGTAATGSLLVPVVGVLAAGVILGDPVGAREVAALALVLSGVALVVARPVRRP